LPALLPSLRNSGFYIAGFGATIDWLFMPLAFLFLSLFPRALEPVARFFAWGLRTFGGHANEATLAVTGAGSTGKIEIRITYADPYELTVLPVVACLKQIAANGAKPGLWRQALFVEPLFFWQEMQRLGVKVRILTNKTT
jgi:saccharopine dehydrogenase (NAD+, L-lysine-forming)